MCKKNLNLLSILLLASAIVTSSVNAEEIEESIYHHKCGKTFAYDGKIYCFGGYSWSSGYKIDGANKVEVYDPDCDSWTELASMPETRSHFELFDNDGKIFLLGGQRWQGNLKQNVYAYDTTTNLWDNTSTHENIPIIMLSPQCAKVNGEIYLVIGQTSIYGSKTQFDIGQVYKFNRTTSEWEDGGATTSMPYPIEWGSMEVYDGKIYVFGGGHQKTYADHYYVTMVQIYDPATKKWTIGRSLHADIYRTTDPSNNFYSFYSPNGAADSTMYSLDTVKLENKAYLFTSYRDISPSSTSTIKDKAYIYKFDTDSWLWCDISGFLSSADLYNETIASGLAIIDNDAYFMDHRDHTKKKFHKLDLTTLNLITYSSPGEITHNIDELQIEATETYEVKSTYYAEDISTISSCELQLYDPISKDFIAMRVWRDKVIKQRCGNSGPGQYYLDGSNDGYPSEYIFIDPSTLAASITENGKQLEITWNFKLNSENVWLENDTSCNYLYFRTTLNSESLWINEDCVPYYSKLSVPGRLLVPDKKRAIYVWSTVTPDLLDNDTELEKFLSFINAPHGNDENRIDEVLLGFRAHNGQSLSTLMATNTPEIVKQLRNFIGELHSRNIKVYYLAGDPDWAKPEYWENDGGIDNMTVFEHINAVRDYNSSTSTTRPEERFDGIHLDIEPHGQTEYEDASVATKKAILTEYVGALDAYATYINEQTWFISDFSFGVAIPFWYQDSDECQITFNSVEKDLYKHVIDIVDSVTTMNYNVGNFSPNLSKDEIYYATNHADSKHVYVALEAGFKNWLDPGENVSFGRFGNTRLDVMAHRMDIIYRDNDAYSGVTYHYYEPDHENGYRKLRLHESGARNIADNSPLCQVITPNGGQIYETDNDISVTFNVYDEDTDTLLADVILCEGANETTIATNVSITVSSSTRRATHTLPFQTSTASSNYKIKVIVRENDGDLENYDTSNAPFSINDNIDGLMLYYSFDENDYNLSLNKVYDKSGSNYDATIQNISQAYPDCDGLVGGAFRFTGESQGYLEANANPIAGLDNFTVSFWFKSNDLYESNNLKSYDLVSAADSTGGTNSGLLAGLQLLDLWDDNGDSLLQNSTTRRDMSDYFEDGEWYFYTAIYNGSNIVEYIDVVNRLNSFKLNTPIGDTNDNNLQVAKAILATDGNFNGWIDELRVYNRALTEDEILFLFNNASGKTQQEIDTYYSQQPTDKSFLSRRGKDSDNDMLTDNDEEFGLPIDNIGTLLITNTSKLTADNDGDKLSDYAEALTYKTSPVMQDQDNDGLNDYQEKIVYKTNPLSANETVFIENYETYELGTNPNSYSDWFIFGMEHTYQEVAGNSQNKYVKIGLSSPFGNVPPAWAPLGFAQKSAWLPGKDLSNAIIAFDIKSNLSAEVKQVIGIQIFTRCNETDATTVFRIPNSELRSIPASASGWKTFVFTTNEITYSEATWKTPDLTKVEKIEIVFLQTAKDFCASGDICIDNFITVDKNDN